MTRRFITVLGSTGSVGRSTLAVVAQHRQRFGVHALVAHASVQAMLQQCLQFEPRFAVMVDPRAARELNGLLQAQGSATRVLSGMPGAIEVAQAEPVDAVMAAIVGAAGLAPTIAAARAGKKVLLANKEALVMAGQVFLEAAAAGGATLLPIDSEHNAVFQCLPPPDAAARAGVARITLTASGGPFRGWSDTALNDVSPEQACAHPNWKMGRKISVDSATMMNKGLELIEAQLLFGLPSARIGCVVHPQSIVHSLVEYVDGSVLAQLGNPDMRIPIAHALGFPDRIDSGAAPLDLISIARLEFEPADEKRLPCLALARQVLNNNGAGACVLNAANEIAVAAFLNQTIGFTQIAHINARTLDEVNMTAQPTDVAAVLELDQIARQAAQRQLTRVFA